MSKPSAQVVIVPSSVKGQQLTSLQISSSTVKIPFAGDLLIDEKGSFYEVARCKESFRSWFCGNMVVKNGSLLMLTPIDTLFLAIPFLLAKRNHFCDLYDILPHESSAKQIYYGLTRETVNLELVADRKNVGDETLYRFNQEKSIRWMKCKLDSTIAALKKIGANVCPTKCSASGYISGRKEDIDIKHYQRFALDFLKSYLPNELVEIVFQDLELGEEDVSMIEEGVVEEETHVKKEMDLKGEKRSLDDSDSLDNKESINGISVKKEDDSKKPKKTKGQVKLEKEAKKPGQSLMTSFFAMKPLKSEVKKE